MDETEPLRKIRLAQLNRDAGARQTLELRYGKVWDTEDLRKDFEVIGFLAPYVAAREKATGKKGSLEFQHDPRFYFNWQEDW